MIMVNYDKYDYDPNHEYHCYIIVTSNFGGQKLTPSHNLDDAKTKNLLFSYCYYYSYCLFGVNKINFFYFHFLPDLACY